MFLCPGHAEGAESFDPGLRVDNGGGDNALRRLAVIPFPPTWTFSPGYWDPTSLAPWNRATGLPNNQVEHDPHRPVNCQQNKWLIEDGLGCGRGRCKTKDLPSESFDQHNLAQGVKTHTEQPGGWVPLVCRHGAVSRAAQVKAESRWR
jgi:hypothetical protein